MFAVAAATLRAAFAPSAPARLRLLGAPLLFAQWVDLLLTIIQIVVVFVLAPGVLQHHLWLGLSVGPADLRQHASMDVLNLAMVVLFVFRALR